MLMIRREQLEILSRPFVAGTEDRALRHLKGCLPQIYVERGEEGMRAIVAWAQRRVARYDIDREVDFFRYLNLMFMFGFEFDTDPRYPWAAAALKGRRPSRAKVDLLMDRAMLFLSRTAAPPPAAP